MVKEPFEKMKERMEHKNFRFSLQLVTEQKVKKAMDDMKREKELRHRRSKSRRHFNSLGGLGNSTHKAYKLVHTKWNLPTVWKIAVVTPLLKKGDQKDKQKHANWRLTKE